MKRFDLCIIIKNDPPILIGSYAFILDDFDNYYHVEIWNFELFEGAKIDSLPKDYLRIATDYEIKEYQIKFKEYCSKNESSQF